MFGPVEDERVGVGDVQAGLDDRGAHQDVVLAIPEPGDRRLELVLIHLTVRDRNPRLGHQLRQFARRLVDRRHPVVDIEHLAVAQQLTANRRGDLFGRICADIGEHRMTLFGRGENS